MKRELQREKERYDDLMALFRATQANQSASIQQQRPVASAPATQPHQQTIPGLGVLQQPQQPSMQQQWATTAGTTSSYLGKYDWTSN